MILLDAKNGIAGRLSAQIAKELLKGNQVEVINAEKCCISGNPEAIIERYYNKRQMTNKANPENATKYSRRPDFFFKKIVTGMLPKHTSRQRDALERLNIHIGVPKSLEKEKAIAPNKTTSDLKGRSVSIEEICAKLGWVKKA